MIVVDSQFVGVSLASNSIYLDRTDKQIRPIVRLCVCLFVYSSIVSVRGVHPMAG